MILRFQWLYRMAIHCNAGPCALLFLDLLLSRSISLCECYSSCRVSSQFIYFTLFTEDGLTVAREMIRYSSKPMLFMWKKIFLLSCPCRDAFPIILSGFVHHIPCKTCVVIDWRLTSKASLRWQVLSWDHFGSYFFPRYVLEYARH